MRAGHVTIEFLPSMHSILGSTPPSQHPYKLKRWRQEDEKCKFIINYIVFKPSLGCLRPCFKSNKNAITALIWVLPSGHHFKTPSSASSTWPCRR